MNKFYKIYDLVKIVAISSIDSNMKYVDIGDVGYIMEIDEDDPFFTYKLKFADGRTLWLHRDTEFKVLSSYTRTILD